MAGPQEARRNQEIRFSQAREAFTEAVRLEESLRQLERARQLIPGISLYEAVTTIGPYVDDDPEWLSRAAGDDPEGAKQD